IPTVYVPHASVTADFPPLSFDYAFLEGQDMLCKYMAAGLTQTKIFLLGMARLDDYIFGNDEIDEGTDAVRLGICANLLDDTDAILTLVDAVLEKLPDTQIEFRAHPRDTRQWDNLLRKH